MSDQTPAKFVGPIRKGEVRNPEGGTPPMANRFQPGNNAWVNNGPAISAGKRISDEIGRVAMEHDAARMREMITWVWDVAAGRIKEDGKMKRWCIAYVSDRLMGRPATIQITNQDGGAMVVQLTQQDADL